MWCICRLQGKYWCYYVLPPLYPTGHMAMNAALLKLANDVFHLRGTTGERVPPLLWAFGLSPSA